MRRSVDGGKISNVFAHSCGQRCLYVKYAKGGRDVQRDMGQKKENKCYVILMVCTDSKLLYI